MFLVGVCCNDIEQAQYLLVLCSFREQLHQHVRVHAVEAVIACREIEQTLQSLTGNKHLMPFHYCPLFFLFFFYYVYLELLAWWG